MTDTDFLVCWFADQNSDIGCRAGKMDESLPNRMAWNGAAAFGGKSVASNTINFYFDLARFDDTTALLCYTRGVGGGNKAAVCSFVNLDLASGVTGVQISEVVATGPDYISNYGLDIAVLSPTLAVVCGSNTRNNGIACQSVTLGGGTPIVFNAYSEANNRDVREKTFIVSPHRFFV